MIKPPLPLDTAGTPLFIETAYQLAYRRLLVLVNQLAAPERPDRPTSYVEGFRDGVTQRLADDLEAIIGNRELAERFSTSTDTIC